MKMLSKTARATRSLLNEFFISFLDRMKMVRVFPRKPNNPMGSFKRKEEKIMGRYVVSRVLSQPIYKNRRVKKFGGKTEGFHKEVRNSEGFHDCLNTR